MTERKSTDWRNVAYHARGVFAVVLALAVLIGGGWSVYNKVDGFWTELTTPDDDYVGEGGEAVDVVIPRGAGITQIGDILYEADVVKSVRKFRTVARRSGRSNELQAGRYELKKQLPAETALEMLLDPNNIKRIWITFPEGTTVDEQASRMSSELGIAADAIEEADGKLGELGLPDWAGDDVEGFFFPARYVVGEPIDPLAVRRTQVDQFKQVAQKLQWTERAESMGRSPLELLTVASVIEGEVHQAEYQPLVAAVIYNRLEQGMKLEMDSTVHYVVGKSGGVTTTAEDRESDSPYNTYKYEGLPPGPINNPGESAMSAALSPADSEALFFVTVDLDTGETLFANTYEEHQENVKKFQQWCQDNPVRCSGS